MGEFLFVERERIRPGDVDQVIDAGVPAENDRSNHDVLLVHRTPHGGLKRWRTLNSRGSFVAKRYVICS